MRLPHEISVAAARRRALLFDALAALAIAIFVVALSAGLGIVGVIGLLALLVGVLWFLAETGLRALRRRPSRLR